MELAMPVIVGLFWRGGSTHRPTLDQVAAELGVSKPTLYRAVGEKDAVLCAALEAYHRTHIRPGEDRLEAGPTLRAGLSAMLELYTNRMTSGTLPPGCFLTDTAAGNEFTEGPVADTLATLQARTWTLLHRRAEQAIADGELAPDTRVESVVRYVLAQFVALSVVSRSEPGHDALQELVGFMLAGLPWASPAQA
jgi:AcrR family transcriptional regulator